MNISNNITSIQTNQSFLNTTAKNIQEGTGDLNKEIPNLITAEKTNAVNVNVVQTQDEMLGSLLDIKT